MRHEPERCVQCTNPPAVDCNGCRQPICTVHRVATWPSADGGDTVDYCQPCFEALPSPPTS